MIPFYRPGTSPLHRVPAGAKLLGLLLLGVAAALFRDNPWMALGLWALVLSGFLAALSGLAGVRELLGRLWALKWLLLLIAVPQLIFLTPAEAALTTARIVAIIQLAALFTLTTRVSDVMDLMLRAFGPLERLGLGRLGLTAERLSLAMSLTMRSVPVVFGFYAEIRQARRARGIRATPLDTARATVPLLVMTLKHAEDTAEALAARGIR